jgi:hypothetical protein
MARSSANLALLVDTLAQAALNAVSALLVEHPWPRAAIAQIVRQVHSVSAPTVKRCVAIAVLVKPANTHPPAVVIVSVAKLVERPL